MAPHRKSNSMCQCLDDQGEPLPGVTATGRRLAVLGGNQNSGCNTKRPAIHALINCFLHTCAHHKPAATCSHASDKVLPLRQLLQTQPHPTRWTPTPRARHNSASCTTCLAPPHTQLLLATHTRPLSALEHQPSQKLLAALHVSRNHTKQHAKQPVSVGAAKKWLACG